MTTDSAHTKGWQISEVVFGLPLLVAIALQLALPLSLPRGILTWITLPVGVGLAGAGIVLVVLARREFARQGQWTDPGHPTTRIITTGVFSISRNPLYLGIAVFLAGAGLAFNFPWELILLLPSLAACHFVLIAPEEKYLRAKFGEEYRAYAARVHRWIGRAPI